MTSHLAAGDLQKFQNFDMSGAGAAGMGGMGDMGGFGEGGAVLDEDDSDDESLPDLVSSSACYQIRQKLTSTRADDVVEQRSPVLEASEHKLQS